MKTHTPEFKVKVSEFGRELNSIITYEENGQTMTLTNEDLFSVTPNYEGGILKSVMKSLEIDTMIDIPLGTTINYQFGVKVRENPTSPDDGYDYIDFGNYIVFSSEKQEDTGSYKLICYDKMLYSMKDYERIFIDREQEEYIEYPISVRDYINAICGHLGLTFKNAETTFTNYDKEIPKELYLDENNKSIGYTFRDVLDELAQVTASTICINEADDELEIRYITDTEDTIDEEYLKDINVNFGEKFGPVNSIVLTRSGGSDSIYAQDSQSIEDDGLCEIKIEDNQIMNQNDRDQYINGILTRLDGLEYYINDFASTGICYYNLCDRYNISVFGTTYSCVMFNDEVLITQGLEENIHTDMPDETETDYKKSDTTDRRINQAYIIVNKQNQTIEAVTSRTEEISTEVNNNYQEIIGKFDGLATTDDITTLTNQVTQLQTDTYTKTEIQQIANGTGADGVKVTAVVSTSATFDENGMHYAQSGASTSSTINQSGLQVNSTGDTAEELLFAGYDTTTEEALVRVANLYLTRYLGLADWRIEEIEDSTYGQGVGFFYLK